MKRQRNVWRFFGRLILAEELFVFIWRCGKSWKAWNTFPLPPRQQKIMGKIIYEIVSGYGPGEVAHW